MDFGPVDLLSDAKGVYGIGVSSVGVPSTVAPSIVPDANQIAAFRKGLSDVGYAAVKNDPEFEDIFSLLVGPPQHHNRHNFLILRADVLKEATFPNKYRGTVLQTLGNRKWCDCYEWELHQIMLDQALERNPRCQTLREIQHITDRCIKEEGQMRNKKSNTTR
jgi:hypothetical protein